MRKAFHVAIVGATGAVGLEMIRVLERRRFPISKLSLFASSRSADRSLQFENQKVTVQELNEEAFDGVDFAFFSANGEISRQYAGIAVQSGAIVIDNSSAFRADPEVPLVIPEINAADVRKHRGIIANPNCTAAIVLMGLYPLHCAFGVKRVFASSYQAVSGSGAQAIQELEQQVRSIGKGEEVEKRIYPRQIAFNVIPHVDSFLDSGYTKEEMKMQDEGRRIMHLPQFRASLTCVRVPVYRAHSVAVSAEFEKPVSLDTARAALLKASGIRLLDDGTLYPVPLDVEGKDTCEVGRLRVDCALDNGLAFWVCGDQLLKGAALNAVQIAELLI